MNKDSKWFALLCQLPKLPLLSPHAFLFSTPKILYYREGADGKQAFLSSFNKTIRDGGSTATQYYFSTADYKLTRTS